MAVNIFYKDLLQYKLIVSFVSSNDYPVESIDTFHNIPNNGTVVDRS